MYSLPSFKQKKRTSFRIKGTTLIFLAVISLAVLLILIGLIS